MKETIALENESVNMFTATDIAEIDKYVSLMEQFIEDFFNWSEKMKQIDPVVYGNEYEKQLLNSISEIRQDIRLAKILKNKLCAVRGKLSNTANYLRDQTKYITKAENLFVELQIRFKSLSKKLDMNLDILSDYQILDIQANKSVDLEFNETLEKVTELASLASLGGEKVVKILDKARKTRDRLALKKENFCDTLSNIILERDITPEKMKQASELTIALQNLLGMMAKWIFSHSGQNSKN